MKKECTNARNTKKTSEQLKWPQLETSGSTSDNRVPRKNEEGWIWREI